MQTKNLGAIEVSIVTSKQAPKHCFYSGYNNPEKLFSEGMTGVFNRKSYTDHLVDFWDGKQEWRVSLQKVRVVEKVVATFERYSASKTSYVGDYVFIFQGVLWTAPVHIQSDNMYKIYDFHTCRHVVVPALPENWQK